MNYVTKLIVGLIGTALVVTFIFGLVRSIAVGFAGMKGGLPVIIISVIVMGMAIYDYWDECIRRKK